jgi:hypothetical protein
MKLLLTVVIALTLLESALSFVKSRTKQNALSFVNSRTKQSSRVPTQLSALDPLELADKAINGAGIFGFAAIGLGFAAIGLLGFSIYQTSVGMNAMRDRMDKAEERMDATETKAEERMDKAEERMTAIETIMANNFTLTTRLAVVSILVSVGVPTIMTVIRNMGYIKV